MTAQTNTPQYYSVERVAVMLDCSAKKVWKMVYEREIESFRMGRARRISREAIEQYAAGCRVPPLHEDFS